ncbi:MarC family protein [Oscillatoria amoena NRMC-F 0135]|nr:MarC family protein [Oscillatoria amoena NRMC-F 0135]
MLNPVGNTPIFFSLTSGDTPAYRRKQAVLSCLYTFVILAVFLLAGQLILKMFGLTVDIIRVAGGLVVAHVGWKMLNAVPALKADEHQEAMDKQDISLSPMALPIMANPGAMSVAVSLGVGAHDAGQFAGSLTALLIMVLFNFACMMTAEPLVRRLGVNGMNALNKILGFLVLCIGVAVLSSGLPGLYHFMTGVKP